MNKNIIITGASGWISTELIKCLEKENYNIFKIDKKYFFNELDRITSLNLNNIVFIHTAFPKPSYVGEVGAEKYKQDLNSNFAAVKKFLLNNKIESLVNFSSGSTYKLRKIDMDLYKPYSDQKLLEEKSFQKLSVDRNFKLLNLKMFALLGKNVKNATPSSFSRIINDAKASKKININSNPKLIVSVCYLESLIELINKYISDPNKKNYFIDAINININLGEFVELVSKKLKISERDIFFCNTHNVIENYVGNKNQYLKILNSYNIENISIQEKIDQLI